MKKLIFYFSIIFFIFLLYSCDTNRRELTRSKAKEILNEYIASQPDNPLFPIKVKRLKFYKDGISHAVQDGIIKYDHGYYKFTDKGLSIVGSLIETRRWYGWNKHIEIDRGSILLKTPMDVEIISIDGIADTPQGEGFKLVKFRTHYILPEQIKPISGYFYIGCRHELIFRRYDDGWRIETKPFKWLSDNWPYIE